MCACSRLGRDAKHFGGLKRYRFTEAIVMPYLSPAICNDFVVFQGTP